MQQIAIHKVDVLIKLYKKKIIQGLKHLKIHV